MTQGVEVDVVVQLDHGRVPHAGRSLLPTHQATASISLVRLTSHTRTSKLHTDRTPVAQGRMELVYPSPTLDRGEVLGRGAPFALYSWPGPLQPLSLAAAAAA